MTVQKLKAAFVYAYKQEEDTVYFVPGRMNLVGEHINYCIDSVFNLH